MGRNDDALEFFLDVVKLATFLQVCVCTVSTHIAKVCIGGHGKKRAGASSCVDRTCLCATPGQSHALPRCWAYPSTPMVHTRTQFVTCGFLFYGCELWGHLDTGACTL